PRTADTDGDGFDDAFEVAHGMDPITQEDFTPVEPDENGNGVIDIWEGTSYLYGFTDADNNGFDDCYEAYHLETASAGNYDVRVDVFTTRSAVLTWTATNETHGIVLLPTTGTSVRLRLPFGADTQIRLLPSPEGTDPPAGELWKSRMRVAFSPRSGQRLFGNALVSQDAMIAHKVVVQERAIELFAASPASGPQTLSSTGGGALGPGTEIKAGMFEVVFADNYHDVGDGVGAFTVTNHVGMGDATYHWISEFGDMEPDSGVESWLTVARLPGHGEDMTVVTTAELDSVSRVAVTSIVGKCISRVFSACLSTNNFSPHLYETNCVTVVLPGCGHTPNPGWLEIEVVRKTIGATQHVASVDMNPQTPAIDRYLDTSALGGQTLSLSWDGIAQVDLPQAEHPDRFTRYDKSVRRIMPKVEQDEPVPHPFYDIRVCLWNHEKTEVLHQHRETVFIPQVVKVYPVPGIESLLATPLVYTNADNSAATLYAGAGSEAAVEQILLDMPNYIMAFVPDSVNLRIVNSEQPTRGGLTNILLTDQASDGDDVLGVCISFDPRNSSPSDIILIKGKSIGALLFDYYRNTPDCPAFSSGLSGSDFATLLAYVCVHEIGHALGLVDPAVLDGISRASPHNFRGTGDNIMDEFITKNLSNILSPSKTRYWRRYNRFYMEFCLPKRKWGAL
ncbi:MAG: hypothetical protein ACOX9C_10480, partial [Kiritimatiellia bacterium]